MLVASHILFILIIAGLGLAFSKVDVHYGQVSIQGYEQCEVVHNDEILKYTGPEKKLLPGLRFGLITYNCDRHVGHLISPLECKACGFFCPYNEYILGCQQKAVPFWMGIILGFSSAAIIGGYLSYRFYKVLNSKRKFADVSSTVTISFSKNTNDEPSANSCIKSAFCEPFDEGSVSDDLAGSFHNRPFVAPSPPSTKRSFKAFFTGLLLNKTANACNLTLLMSPNQAWRVCDNTLCQATPVYAFSFTQGQEICFKDYLGETVALSVSKTYIRTRYEFAYHTSDYEMMNLTTSSDYSECMRDKNSCYSSDKRHSCHNETLAALNEEAEERDESAKGWGCDVFPRANQHSSGYVCCRYSWETRKIGELYPVYSRLNKIWVVKFLVHQNDSSREIVLNSYDPATILTGLKLNTVHDIPLSLLNLTYSASLGVKKLSKGLLVYENRAFFVNSSAPNKPKPKNIGDYQVLLSQNRATFAMPVVSCQEKNKHASSNCSCTCSAPKTVSALKELGKNLSQVAFADNFVKRGENIVDTFQEVGNGTFFVKLDEWRVEDSPIKREGKCDLDYVMTYGAKDSNESSYIVVVPRNVKVEGLIPFHSNCNFDKAYMKCDLEPVKLILKGVYDTCFINIPTLNTKMSIHVQYLYLGHRNSSENSLKDTASEALRHLMTNAHFTKSYIYTFLLCLVLEMFLTFVYYKVLTKRTDGAKSVKAIPFISCHS